MGSDMRFQSITADIGPLVMSQVQVKPDPGQAADGQCSFLYLAWTACNTLGTELHSFTHAVISSLRSLSCSTVSNRLVTVTQAHGSFSCCHDMFLVTAAVMRFVLFPWSCVLG